MSEAPERIWVLERTDRYLSQQLQDTPPTEDQIVNGWTWHEYTLAAEAALPAPPADAAKE